MNVLWSNIEEIRNWPNQSLSPPHVWTLYPVAKLKKQFWRKGWKEEKKKHDTGQGLKIAVRGPRTREETNWRPAAI